MDISLDAQVEEAYRELRLRKRVYPRLVAQSHLTEEKAATQMALQQAIIRTLEDAAERHSAQLPLFAKEGR